MYRKHHNGQLSIEELHVPFGGTLDPENRWVLFASLMPWEEMEETSAPQFSPKTGAPAKPVRLAFGALFIKQRLGLTDEETVEQVRENAYIQYFLGFAGYSSKPPFEVVGSSMHIGSARVAPLGGMAIDTSVTERFSDWVAEQLDERTTEALLDYRRQHPDALQAQTSDELANTINLLDQSLGSVGALMAVLSSPDAAGASVGTPQTEVESALTGRYQTTVPQPVRQALGLRKRDRIRYSFRANGEVVLQRVSPDPIEEDPALAPFLAQGAQAAGRLQQLTGRLLGAEG
jgi:bifunctional DNA-binding transcriptional regulator/antitoxin component of YhaV-PrlF toxin-antitoxin module